MYSKPIYSVLGKPLSIDVLLCANMRDVGTQTEKCHLVDNRCPLMCEVRGKRWPKYIIIFIFGELRNPKEQREYLKQIHSNVIYKVTSEDAMFISLEH